MTAGEDASLLDVRGLEVRYGTRVAVADLDLAVAPGEIVGLLGPNGAGKSTALGAIAGALPATRGTIAVAGVDVAVGAAARARLGFAEQPPALFDYLTVAEHLGFVAEARGHSGDGQRAAAALGLDAVAGRLCRELSFGYRQRVALAAALAGETRVILLDETLNGLDPRASRLAREAVEAAAAAGAAVVLSTHLLGVAERLCTRLVFLDRGRVVREVAGAELAELVAAGAAALEELYLATVSAEPA